MRHTRVGVALCAVLPALLVGYTMVSAAAPHPRLTIVLAVAVAVLSPPLLLADAALAYPPAGVAVIGGGTIAAYPGLGLLGQPTAADLLLLGGTTLAVATGTCAFASSNHVSAYRRTAATRG